MKGRGFSLLNLVRWIFDHDVPFHVDSKRHFVRTIESHNPFDINFLYSTFAILSYPLFLRIFSGLSFEELAIVSSGSWTCLIAALSSSAYPKVHFFCPPS